MLEALPTFVVAGVPLIVLVFALVEEIKAYGVISGKALRAVSLVLGILAALAFQLATAIPATPMEWLTIVVVGLLYGLTASGAYDFLDGRLPVKA